MPYGFMLLMAVLVAGCAVPWVVLRWLGHWSRMSRWSRAASLLVGVILALALATGLGELLNIWYSTHAKPIIWA